VSKILICLWGALACVMIGAEPVSFTKSVYPVLEEAGCRNCHNADGVASATRLHFPETGAGTPQVAAFGNSLVVLVDAKDPANSLLFRKPTARIPHAGGQRIVPGSPQETALRSWIDQLASLKGDDLAAALRYRDDSGGARPSVTLRRLTNSQYNHTVRDLLGNNGSPANQFPPEDFVNGFKNQFASQSLSPLLEDAYSNAAEKLAKRAFRNGVPATMIACQPSAACRAEFVRSFGQKAFRRPLDPAEVRRYEGVFQQGKDFATGAQLVVEVMLQSPNFLFRLEDTDNPKWRPYAEASRLSYALWDSMPDDVLLAAAGRGELDHPQGVEKVARRMLQDPKAKEALEEFVSQWLRFDRALTATKEQRTFPGFNASAAQATTEEARRFVADLVWNGEDFTQIFTAPYGYVNADLARIYKVDAPATDFARVPFPANSERAGLLGQAMFLAMTAKPDDTSPTARGLFVREQFLCQHVADPPPGVNTNLPPVTEARPVSNRERLAMHTTNKTCAGCHSLVDPIGFGFEKFDAIGQRRDRLKLVFGMIVGESKAPERKVTMEVDLDTTGQVAGLPNSAFSSPKELGAVLAASPQCQECIVKQYFRYVSGRMETAADRPQIHEIFDSFRKSGFRFQELMVATMMEQSRRTEGGQRIAVRNH